MSWLEREVLQEEAQSAEPEMSFGQRMMAAMGHKEGEGLGKEGAGMKPQLILTFVFQANLKSCFVFVP